MAVAEQMQLMHAALDALREEERRLLEIETASSAPRADQRDASAKQVPPHATPTSCANPEAPAMTEPYAAETSVVHIERADV